jgi:hypothetical protein
MAVATISRLKLTNDQKENMYFEKLLPTALIIVIHIYISFS